MTTLKQTHRTANSLFLKAQRIVAPLMVVGALNVGGCTPNKNETGVFVTGISTACMEKQRCEMLVKKGFDLTKVHFNDDTKGYFQFRVADVDAKGVTFEMVMAFYHSERAYGKFRMNFDGTRDRWPDKILGHQTITVEKTCDPGIAKVVTERKG